MQEDELTYHSDNESLNQIFYEQEEFNTFCIFDYLPKLSRPSLIYGVIKFIVCRVLRRVDHSPMVYMETLPVFFRQYHDIMMKMFHSLKKANSRKVKIIKDYGTVLKLLMKDLRFHLVVNKILKEIREEFHERKYGRIKLANVQEYEIAINSLYIGSENFLRNYII